MLKLNEPELFTPGVDKLIKFDLRRVFVIINFINIITGRMANQIEN